MMTVAELIFADSHARGLRHFFGLPGRGFLLDPRCDAEATSTLGLKVNEGVALHSCERLRRFVSTSRHQWGRPLLAVWLFPWPPVPQELR